MSGALRVSINIDSRLGFPKLLLVVLIVNNALFHRDPRDYLNALVFTLPLSFQILVLD